LPIGRGKQRRDYVGHVCQLLKNGFPQPIGSESRHMNTEIGMWQDGENKSSVISFQSSVITGGMAKADG
jgi:hypothetical protein